MADLPDLTRFKNRRRPTRTVAGPPRPPQIDARRIVAATSGLDGRERVAPVQPGQRGERGADGKPRPVPGGRPAARPAAPRGARAPRPAAGSSPRGGSQSPAARAVAARVTTPDPRNAQHAPDRGGGSENPAPPRARIGRASAARTVSADSLGSKLKEGDKQYQTRVPRKANTALGRAIASAESGDLKGTTLTGDELRTFGRNYNRTHKSKLTTEELLIMATNLKKRGKGKALFNKNFRVPGSSETSTIEG